ncbi:MAG: TIGR04086 family membrane protein [Halanaerobiales bacterium]|nr:TIGR04086 family membrane protein [Halanaerobiales bacterium]
MFDHRDQDKLIYNMVILKGVTRGIAFLLIVSSILALFSGLVYSLNTRSLNILLITLNTIIITYIGFYIARHVGKNGWLNGGLGGLIYMGIVILIGTISMPISIGYIFLLLMIGLVTGSIGGIIGINL